MYKVHGLDGLIATCCLKRRVLTRQENEMQKTWYKNLIGPFLWWERGNVGTFK